MSLTLKGFGQDVDLDNKSLIQHYLVFLKEDGSQLRIPVPEETTKELIRQVYAEPSVPLHKLAEDDVPEPEDDPISSGATEFSADDADLPEDDEVEDDDEDGPQDESEVPSL